MPTCGWRDIDRTADRFTDISHTPRAAEAHPTWRGDGLQLAWVSRPHIPGAAGIYIWDTSRPIVAATWLGTGSWPAWNADGNQLASVVETPTQQLMTAFTRLGTPLILPVPLPGVVRGVAWPMKALPEPLPTAFQASAQSAVASVESDDGRGATRRAGRTLAHRAD